jgi:hypothetical protein
VREPPTLQSPPGRSINKFLDPADIFGDNGATSMKHPIVIAAALGLGLLMIGTGPASAGSCASQSPNPKSAEVESIIEDVALIHSLDPTLLSAIARVESGECTDAISPKGAVGLMQLMPATASEFGVENRFDPVQNALGAARLIDYLKRDRPDGNFSLPEVLAAYNAGEGSVTRAGGIPHYRETEEYVRRVLWLYLLGHGPESQRARKTGHVEPLRSKSGATKVEATRRSRDGDRAILDQLAEVRRARESDSAQIAAPQ